MASAADLEMWGIVALILPVVGLGVAESGRLAGTDASTARRQAMSVCAALSLWLLAVGGLASAGVFLNFAARPPRLTVIQATAFATGMTLMSRQVRRDQTCL